MRGRRIISREQASAYIGNLEIKGTISVDFAVWVPHAGRIEKMRAMEGQKIDASG